jgi:uncharacterized protein DUF3891
VHRLILFDLSISNGLAPFPLQMIIQPDPTSNEFITISQTSHSWMSGQIARAWGNEIFSSFSPFEQICYAAEQHDIGFLSWEANPVLNEFTGLPFTFEDLPEAIHFEIWRTGISQLKPVCYYAALVVSLHFCNLCRRFYKASSGQSEASNFLEEQGAFQEEALKALRDDSLLGSAVKTDVLAYHCDLVGSWDFFSLQLCRGKADKFIVPQVPVLEKERVDIELRKTEHEQNIWEVSPWPFNAKTLNVFCEGRVLSQKFDDGEKMKRALQTGNRKTVCFTLCRSPD